MSNIEADVALILPKTSATEQAVINARYGGLVGCLADLSVTSFFAYGADSYDHATDRFATVYQADHTIVADSGIARVGRDLTIASTYDRPLYTQSGLQIVNSPKVNEYLAATREASTPTTDTDEATKVRLISIGGAVIGAVSWRPAGGNTGRKQYLDFAAPDDLSDPLKTAAETLQQQVAAETGSHTTVYGIDVAGSADGPVSATLLRKPIRVSAWDLQYPDNSATAVMKLATAWNGAEATLLATAAAA